MDWHDLFGHETPYEPQVDAIEAMLSAGRSGGFAVIEGACGTGKTMAALTAGLTLVRDQSSQFERVVVLTSVKQQLRQFEEDLETINRNVPSDWEPISGLTLVGKADVCPYTRERIGSFDEITVYDRCDTLREQTRQLEEAHSAGELVADARGQQIGLADSGQADSALQFLETAGATAPYPPSIPTRDETSFCPFYAQYLADRPDEEDHSLEAVPADLTSRGLIRPDDLVALSTEYGSCPHSIMGAALPWVEVVIGNYYHAFDPTTVATFTGPLLDQSTFVICDEAHMLEPRVRSLVGSSVGDATIRTAIGELSRVLRPMEREEAGQAVAAGSRAVTEEHVRATLSNASISLADCRHILSFLRELRSELDRRVTDHLDQTEPGWQNRLKSLSDEELPLRDPATPEEDTLTRWARSAGYDADTWLTAESVGATVADIINTAEETVQSRACMAVGRLLSEWSRRDHTANFRTIALERTWNETESADSWRRGYSASLCLHNCLPRSTLASQLDTFGGGVLMSATLEPLDIITSVTGLDTLAEEYDRPVHTRRYGLHFPSENRRSYAVALPKFTHENRGRPHEHNEVRRTYADALTDIARLPGNVLIGMPSYREAQWAAGKLDDRLEQRVLLDESSGDAVTESLKDEFFQGGGKVLVTSLRGTLTEGVDYRGDRLSVAAVCGVPIVDTSSPVTRAIRRAYDDAFDDGFRYALQVPAVRKARQAIGRVIRGTDDVGVRFLLDERYARQTWDSVRDDLPEREEFTSVSPDMLDLAIEDASDALDR